MGPIPAQIEEGDFNRDGRLDVAILSIGTTSSSGLEYRQSLYVLRGDGAGGFATPYTIAAPTTDPAARFATGDFNGDGWLDLALLEASYGHVRLALNTADPESFGFQEQPEPSAVDVSHRDIAAGDFDEDSRDDVVVGGAGGALSGYADLLVSSGDGTLAAPVRYSLSGRVQRLSATDIDGDGHLDLALATSTGGGLYHACVLQGDGGGALADPVSTTIFDPAADLAAGDLDGNGALDLVIAQPTSRLLTSVLATVVPEGQGVFMRGDANADRQIDVSDPVAVLLYLFAGGATDCLEALDVNDDFDVDITDPVHLLGFLFLGGSPPPPPFPDEAADGAEETLGCER
ncbi:MAG: VCBS repeat-containing protein [Planctomycetes bacterium]|nr:VCBS repeat-containing protein [Planctomycetota bacterium]